MAEPFTAAAIGTVLVKALKEVGKWIWGYAKRTLLTFWENKYILLIAGACSGIFIYYYNMLHGWFAFPSILNIAVLGIFALINIAWVASYWKSIPSEGNNSEGPKVNIN